MRGETMPFRSDAQRRFMYAKHPEIARRWSAEEKTMKDGPRFGNGGSRGHRLSTKDDGVVEKAYRQYTPEHRRQRRLGQQEAVLVIGGGAAGGEGTRRIVRDTRQLRGVKVFNGVGAKHSVLGNTPIGRGSLKVGRTPGLLVGGGLAALAGAGATRRHAESNKGRPWD